MVFETHLALEYKYILCLSVTVVFVSVFVVSAERPVHIVEGSLLCVTILDTTEASRLRTGKTEGSHAPC